MENNYLSDAQATQEQKELKQCTNIGCTAKVKTQWAAINAAQQASFTAGIVVGLPAGAIEPIKELVHMATNPGETYEALRGLFTSGNILGNVSDAVKESYISRLNKLEEEYQRAGVSGSYNAGVETGKLLVDMAALATGAGGAAKAGIKVTEKAIAKVANAAKKEVIEAGKGAGKGANIAKGGAGKGIDVAQTEKLAVQAQQELINEINKFKSNTQAEKVAAMIGAYDPVTGKTAVGYSNKLITAESLHPTTVSYIETQLGVKIGEFTSFCKNKAGACAEVSAADSLIRQGAKPENIHFTQAIRPKAFRQQNSIISEKVIVKTCDNCKVTWPRGTK